MIISGVSLLSFFWLLTISTCTKYNYKCRCLLNFSCFFYMLFSIAVAGSLVAGGFAFQWVGDNGQGYLKNMCDNIESGNKTLDKYETQIYNIDILIQKGLNEHMCTAYCPCYESPKTYAKYNGYNDLVYNKFNRTKVLFNSIWGPHKYMVWSEQRKFTFDSMLECHDKYLQRALNTNLTMFTQFIDLQQFQIATDHKELVQYVERTFRCSGICHKSLFFYSLDVEEGRPLVTCGETILAKILPYSYKVASVLFVSAGLFLIFLKLTFWAFCCCRKSKAPISDNHGEFVLEIENDVVISSNNVFNTQENDYKNPYDTDPNDNTQDKHQDEKANDQHDEIEMMETNGK